MKYPLWTSKEAVDMSIEFRLFAVNDETLEVSLKDSFRLTQQEARLLAMYLKENSYAD